MSNKRWIEKSDHRGCPDCGVWNLQQATRCGVCGYVPYDVYLHVAELEARIEILEGTVGIAK